MKPFGARSLVIGATGFIGCRLLERLLLEHAHPVRVMLRRFDHASRLARFKLDIAQGSMTDEPALDRAIAGCDVVYQCAHDWHSMQANKDSVEALTRACLKHGVKRLIFVSTYAVYQPFPPEGILEESRPFASHGWEYCETKHAMEQDFLRMHRERGLPVVILQPTIVYGPYSQPWTIGPVDKLRTGRVVLPGDGSGLCNAVYVDDVVDAMIGAAGSSAAEGRSFIISGPAPTTWRRFYEAMQEAAGVSGALEFQPAEALWAMLKKADLPATPPVVESPLAAFIRRTPLISLYRQARKRLGGSLLAGVKKKLSSVQYMPSELHMHMYCSKAPASIQQAKTVFGYAPRYDFETGFQVTREYVKRICT